MDIRPILLSTTTLLGLTLGVTTASADVFSTALKPITTIGSIRISPSTEVQPPSSKPVQYASSEPFQKIQNVLNQHMGQPYVWGGNGPNSFDCSGLTKFVFAHALDIDLKRTAEQQFHQFPHVKHRDVRPGDLVFFSYNHGATIDHVGIVVDGQNMMIDAQNQGVIRESYMAPWWQDSIAGYARVFNPS